MNVSLIDNIFTINGEFSKSKFELEKVPAAGDLILHFAAHCSAEVSSACIDLKEIETIVSIFDDVFIDAYIVNNNGRLIYLNDLKHYINDNDLREDQLIDLLNLDF